MNDDDRREIDFFWNSILLVIVVLGLIAGSGV